MTEQEKTHFKKRTQQSKVGLRTDAATKKTPETKVARILLWNLQRQLGPTHTLTWTSVFKEERVVSFVYTKFVVTGTGSL